MRARPLYSQRTARRLLWSLFPALALLLRWLLPQRPAGEVGPRALVDAGLSLMLTASVLTAAFLLGRRALRAFHMQDTTPLEHGLLAATLGLGALAYAATGLGLAGWLNQATLAATLLAAAWIGATQPPTLPPDFASQLRKSWRGLGWLQRAIAFQGGLIALLALIYALAPPWDYDGLMYHLVGPRIFLEAGRIFPYPDIWYLNGPFSVEMLFAFGMALGDDIFPKLIHYAFGALLLLSTGTLARRWLGPRGAWLAVATLLTIPTLPLLAALAYIDLAWATYEFLALVLVVWWAETQEEALLLLAGVFLGLALGTKYLALFGLLVLAALVWTRVWRRPLGIQARALLYLLGPALVLAAPWYLRNALWFGNPVYPLLFGGPGWDAESLGLTQAYIQSFGTGRRWSDWLLLPWNIYRHRQAFGAVMNAIDIPSVLFPLLVLLPLRKVPRPIPMLVTASAARFLLWALGSQQVRFLLPIYPALALGVAALLPRLLRRERVRPAWVSLFPMLAVGLIFVTLFYQVRLLTQNAPYRPVLGLESRKAFLNRTVSDYSALQWAEGMLGPDEKVLLLGDGRSYYCYPRCIPDPSHFRWAAAIRELPDPAALVLWMEDRGARFLLINWEDLEFLLQHDPKNVLRSALVRLIAWREQGCLRQVYADDKTEIYLPGCQGQGDADARYRLGINLATPTAAFSMPRDSRTGAPRGPAS